MTHANLLKPIQVTTSYTGLVLFISGDDSNEVDGLFIDDVSQSQLRISGVPSSSIIQDRNMMVMQYMQVIYAIHITTSDTVAGYVAMMVKGVP